MENRLRDGTGDPAVCCCWTVHAGVLMAWSWPTTSAAWVFKKQEREATTAYGRDVMRPCAVVVSSPRLRCLTLMQPLVHRRRGAVTLPCADELPLISGARSVLLAG